MTSFDDVRAAAAGLPEVEVSTSYGTPALKVRGKSFARLWSEREHNRDDVHDTAVLVVFCDAEEKPHLLAADPDALFSTPHYEGHGAMLVRLDAVGPDDLVDYLEDSYRLKAPKTLVRRLDEDPQPGSSR